MPIDFKIGCSGFYYKNWRGVFYPEKLSQSKWLHFYADNFNTLELNATFYRFPTLDAMKAWHKKVPEDFVFSVKASRIITHLKKLKECEQLLDDLYTVCKQGLKKKLGCILFQFPPGVHYSEEMLKKITDSLRPEFKNVVEFRHESWWTQQVYDTLNQHGLAFCSVSHPTLPADVITTAGRAYVRMHGVPDMFRSAYSLMELEALKRALVKDKTITEAYVYFNNTDGPYGAQNAKELKKMIHGL